MVMALCQRLNTPEKEIWKMNAYKFLRYAGYVIEENTPPEEQKKEMASASDLMSKQKRRQIMRI